MDSDLAKALAKITDRTDFLIWAAFAAAERGEAPPYGSRMVFPRYASGKLRVSEQEARFFFVRAIEESQFFYSVETPTERLYKQSGAAPSRASFDVTVRDDATQPVAHCEFKFGGISQNRKNRMPVAKDLEKLLRDPGDGLWFHLLESTDNATVSNVLDTIGGEITVLIERFAAEIEPKTITVHVCVLRHGFSVHREVIIDPQANQSTLRQQLMLSYNVTRTKLTHCSESDGWRVCRCLNPLPLFNKSV